MAEQWSFQDETSAGGQKQPASDDSLDTLLDAGPKALAKRRRVSVRTLRRQFVRAGTTLSSYLRVIRRRGVAALLRRTDLSLAEIARRVGLSSGVVLARFVRREFDATPGALRKQLKKIRSSAEMKAASPPSTGTP